MISLNIQTAGEQAIADALREYPKQATRAIVRGLNRGISSGRTLMVKAIAADTGLKSGDVRNAISMREATASKLEARLAASLKRIPLIQFNAKGPEPSRGQGRGVSYRLRGSKGRLPHAFISTMVSGHRGVFARSGQTRLPIRELQGPSLGHVFGKYRPQGIARAREVFESTFWQALGFLKGSDAGTD